MNIEEFVAQYGHSVNTQRTYRQNLKCFFKVIGADDKTYIDKDRDYKADVRKFYSSISVRPPKSVDSLMATLRVYLEDSDVELGNKFWKRLKGKNKQKVEAVTDDRIPTHEEMRNILTHMNSRGRALFLIQISSGMRIGELLQLKLKDIHLDENPVRISIPAEYTKGRSKRTTFITNEAKKALKQWLNVRDNWLLSASKRVVNKPHYKVFKGIDLNSEQIFPFTDFTACIIWRNALKKARLDERDDRTKRYKLHTHSLRKFFNSHMEEHSEKLTRILMGHRGYLGEYSRYSDKRLAQFYQEHCLCLSIFTDKEKIDEFIGPKIRDQEVAISSLVSRNKDLEAEMENLRHTVDLLHRAMKNVLLPEIEHEQEKKEIEEQDQLIKQRAMSELSREMTPKILREEKEKMRELVVKLKKLNLKA